MKGYYDDKRKEAERVRRMQAVVDAAKEIANMSPVMEAGRHSLYELREGDMKPLRDAIDALEGME